MTWLTSKLAEIQGILKTVYFLVVIAIAIKLLVEKKIIGVVLFALTAGLLGWFVMDPEGAVTTWKGLFK